MFPQLSVLVFRPADRRDPPSRNAYPSAAIAAVVEILEQAAVDALLGRIFFLHHAELDPPGIGELEVIDHLPVLLPEGWIAGSHAAELRGLDEGVGIEARIETGAVLAEHKLDVGDRHFHPFGDDLVAFLRILLPPGDG